MTLDRQTAIAKNYDSYKNYGHALRWLIYLVLSLCATPAAAQHSREAEQQLHRQQFLQAEHAIKKHDWKKVDTWQTALQDYSLHPYLIYAALKEKIHTSTPPSLKELTDFEIRSPDFPFHDRLRHWWLFQMAKNKQWQHFLDGYRETNNEALQCHYHFAQYQTTQDPTHLKATPSLWLVGYSQDRACDPLFHAWQKHGGLTKEMVIKRIKLALDNKQYTLAVHLSKNLPKAQRQWVLEWEKYTTTPSLIQNQSTIENMQAPKKIKTEIITRALREWTKQEPEKVAQWWAVHHNDLLFTTSQENQIKRDISVTLAQQKSRLAEEWLDALPSQARDTVAHEWSIRIALTKHQWKKAMNAILSLPKNQQNEPVWQYWLARSYIEQGFSEIGNTLYKTLAQTRGYYGFLSSIRLTQALTMEEDHTTIDPKQYTTILATPAFARFEELRAIGRDTVARIEWFHAIEKMPADIQRATASIAQKMGLHDLAIFTLAKSPYKNDLTLRFPLAHEPEVFRAARAHHLDPAWVFAVARQESAFYSDALSPAGARGLMQLMPTTAKMLAKQHHISYQLTSDLHQPLTNIQLGTAYLGDLKTRLYDHIILATAAYNAGPGRIPRWLYDAPMDADIWVENIPYKETREYIKNVMAYTAIYQHRLGRADHFSDMLVPIPGKATIVAS